MELSHAGYSVNLRPIYLSIMSCFGSCIPTPDAYVKDIVAKMKKTASEGGDILLNEPSPQP